MRDNLFDAARAIARARAIDGNICRKRGEEDIYGLLWAAFAVDARARQGIYRGTTPKCCEKDDTARDGGVVDHLTRLNYAIIVRADANAVYTGMYMEKTTVRE